jgi:hypothetical protein
MALTRVSGLSPNVSVAGSVTSDLVSTNLAQIGAATTVHTTGIDLGSGNITSHNIISTGIVTATAFVGDGSQLTGISGGGGGQLGIRVKDDGSLIGIAATVNFGTNLEATNYDAATSSVTINSTGVSQSLAIAYAVAL